MKNNVELHINSDSMLVASDNCNDFTELSGLKHVNSQKLPRFRNFCIIFAEETEKIALTGYGTIDCSGNKFVEKSDDYRMPYKRLDIPTPPRAVFFTGCKNVRIENITMQNQPAGWSFWIHDCDFVHFDKIRIDACLDYPNNDGIHINSSRNVTVSDCFIRCGDDCIVLRANNSSLTENKICENISVSGCTLVTRCNGIRIGWLCDGVIRNCTLSNIVITESQVGIAAVLPFPQKEPMSDCGREETLIENISFCNIIMDKCYCAPVWIDIADNAQTKCKSIQNLYFDNLHARSCELPFISGRESNHVKNIRFSNCTFEKIKSSEKDPEKNSGATEKLVFGSDSYHSIQLHHCDNVVFNCTSFSVSE